jgi:hypothetical protein
MEYEAFGRTDFRNRMKKTKVDDRSLYRGDHGPRLLGNDALARSAHHATERPIFGLGMVEELARHGYRISSGKPLRTIYRATPLGRKALAAATARVPEFIEKLMEGQRRAC